MDGDNDDNSCSSEGNDVGWCDFSLPDVEEDTCTWSEVNDPYTIVTYDQATHEAWETAKTEISIVRENILRLLQLEKWSDFRITDLLNFLIGPSSSIWKLVDDNMNGSGIW